MSVHDLLEERAERGLPRGASTVWAGAHTATRTANPDPIRERRAAPAHSAGWFRLAVGLGAAALLFVVIARPGSGPSDPSDTVAPDVSRTGEVASQPHEVDGPLPDPILVEGMTLEQVGEPFDPTACCEPDVFDRFFGREPGVDTVDTHQEGSQVQIFARPETPFDGPIVGIELLDGGGFRPWGANLGERPLEGFTDQLVRVDGSWAMDPTSGLAEVARFESRIDGWFESGWQFDFADGPETATVQAEPDPGGGEWVWVVRLLPRTGDGGPTVQLAASTVFGQPAIVVNDGRDEADDVIWTRGDLVYRFTTGRVEGNTHFSASAVDEIPRLRLADRAEWADAVAGSGDGSIGFSILIGLQLLAVVAWLVSAVFFLIKGPRVLAPVGVLAAFGWVALGPANGLTIVLVVGLAAAWYYRSQRPGSQGGGTKGGESQQPFQDTTA